jgi:hypothetical protein
VAKSLRRCKYFDTTLINGGAPASVDQVRILVGHVVVASTFRNSNPGIFVEAVATSIPGPRRDPLLMIGFGCFLHAEGLQLCCTCG